ncbi:MAG: hypothetical protein HYR91_13430 [Flavobacteriia bacterium]|nr:hypothetical protein [Flavobacteriia bacterium]
MKTQTHKQTKKQSHIALKNIEGVICSEWLTEHLNISELEINMHIPVMLTTPFRS